jgi:tryptophan-rich sensory protein
LQWSTVVIAAVSAIAVASVGGALTDIGPWYLSLKEPAWKPPDAAFGVIWTGIFALTALAGVVAWQREPLGQRRRWMLRLFAANGLLNILWSFLFFHIRRPDLALFEVAFLWLSVLVLIVFVFRRSPLAGALLAPYLVWVSLASALNYDVVLLNGPFR